MANEDVIDFVARATVQLKDMSAEIDTLIEGGDPDLRKNFETLKFKIENALKTVNVIDKKVNKPPVEAAPEEETWE